MEMVIDIDGNDSFDRKTFSITEEGDRIFVDVESISYDKCDQWTDYIDFDGCREEIYPMASQLTTPRYKT